MTMDKLQYDEIGNLIADQKEDIDDIQWNVYGKISYIHKTTGVEIWYTYDAAGNRISKRVKDPNNGIENLTTWYVRDAEGKVLSVYIFNDPNIHSRQLTQTELHLYGSSRLGMVQPEINVQTITYPEETYLPLLGSGYTFDFSRGKKLFELSNHLQNVLVTISDKKIGVDNNSDGTIDYYNADVITAQDYYPFGQLQPGRQYGTLGRHGINGKEQDPEVKGTGAQYDYGFRIYDPRLGRFLSVDPLFKSFPWNSPYAFAEGDPINFIDLDGLEKADPPYKEKSVNFIQLFRPFVQGIKRSDDKTFTETALSYDDAKMIDYTVNAQQYEMNGISNPFSAGDNSDWTAQGRTTSNGKVFVGRSSPSTFYFSMKDGKTTFGQGDAPLDAGLAVGGGIPVIINGLKYGEKNIYSADAPAGLPEVGDPGGANQKYLLQRSNAGYPKQDNATVGKSILGYNSKTGAFTTR